MLEFKQRTPIRNDCTAGFSVTLDRPYTVGLFIDEILADRKNEYGYIGIFKPGVAYVFGSPCVRYEYGRLTSDSMPEDILRRVIKEVKADGGWTRMDYIIKLED